MKVQIISTRPGSKTYKTDQIVDLDDYRPLNHGEQCVNPDDLFVELKKPTIAEQVYGVLDEVYDASYKYTIYTKKIKIEKKEQAMNKYTLELDGKSFYALAYLINHFGSLTSSSYEVNSNLTKINYIGIWDEYFKPYFTKDKTIGKEPAPIQKKPVIRFVYLKDGEETTRAINLDSMTNLHVAGTEVETGQYKKFLAANIVRYLPEGGE